MEAGVNNPLRVGYRAVPRAPMILALALLISALAAKGVKDKVETTLVVTIK